jgi:hypothetical protein
MLDKLNYEDFALHVGTKFRLTEAPEPLEIELIEASEPRATPQQIMFSLFFLGPKNLLLPQRIYQLAHEQLGEGTLFLVPIGQSDEGVKYEAVFNRMVKQK